MSQFTVRGVPQELDVKLRGLSRRNHVSLNRTVVSILEKAMGTTHRPVVHRDLSSVAGKWTDREACEFDGSLKLFESLDEQVWQ
jgi:hypothetical protein